MPRKHRQTFHVSGDLSFDGAVPVQAAHHTHGRPLRNWSVVHSGKKYDVTDFTSCGMKIVCDGKIVWSGARLHGGHYHTHSTTLSEGNLQAVLDLVKDGDARHAKAPPVPKVPGSTVRAKPGPTPKPAKARKKPGPKPKAKAAKKAKLTAAELAEVRRKNLEKKAKPAKAKKSKPKAAKKGKPGPKPKAAKKAKLTAAELAEKGRATRAAKAKKAKPAKAKKSKPGPKPKTVEMAKGRYINLLKKAGRTVDPGVVSGPARVTLTKAFLKQLKAEAKKTAHKKPGPKPKPAKARKKPGPKPKKAKAAKKAKLTAAKPGPKPKAAKKGKPGPKPKAHKKPGPKTKAKKAPKSKRESKPKTRTPAQLAALARGAVWRVAKARGMSESAFNKLWKDANGDADAARKALPGGPVAKPKAAKKGKPGPRPKAKKAARKKPGPKPKKVKAPKAPKPKKAARKKPGPKPKKVKAPKAPKPKKAPKAPKAPPSSKPTKPMVDQEVFAKIKAQLKKEGQEEAFPIYQKIWKSGGKDAAIRWMHAHKFGNVVDAFTDWAAKHPGEAQAMMA